MHVYTKPQSAETQTHSLLDLSNLFVCLTAFSQSSFRTQMKVWSQNQSETETASGLDTHFHAASASHLQYSLKASLMLRCCWSSCCCCCRMQLWTDRSSRAAAFPRRCRRSWISSVCGSSCADPGHRADACAFSSASELCSKHRHICTQTHRSYTTDTHHTPAACSFPTVPCVSCLLSLHPGDWGVLIVHCSDISVFLSISAGTDPPWCHRKCSQPAADASVHTPAPERSTVFTITDLQMINMIKLFCHTQSHVFCLWLTV